MGTPVNTSPERGSPTSRATFGANANPPHVDAHATVIAHREVHDATVVHASCAFYRGATFRGIIQIADDESVLAALVAQGAGPRVHGMLTWYGWRPETRHPEIQLEGDWRVERNYSGPVIDMLGRPDVAAAPPTEPRVDARTTRHGRCAVRLAAAHQSTALTRLRVHDPPSATRVPSLDVMLRCDIQQFRVSPVRAGRRQVTATCRITGPSGLAVIRVDARIAITDHVPTAWQGFNRLLAMQDGVAWVPPDAARASASSDRASGTPVRVRASVPSDLRPDELRAHLSGTAYVGRWWPIDTDIVLSGGLGAEATWRDAITAGHVYLDAGPVDRDGRRSRIAHISAWPRQPDAIDGLPLVVLRVELVVESGPGRGAVRATAHVILAKPPADEYAEKPEVPGSTVDAAFPIAVRLPARGSPRERLRVRLTLGASTYRFGRVVRVVAFDPDVVAVTGGQAHMPTTPGPDSTSPLPRDPHSVAGALTDEDEKDSEVFTNRDSAPISWNAEGYHEYGDDEVPAFADTAVWSVGLNTASGDEVKLEELSSDERREPARLCTLGLDDNPGFDHHERRLSGVQVVEADLIWDGITVVPGMPPFPIEEGHDGPMVWNHGPLVRLCLSRRAELESLGYSLGFLQSLTILPAARAARGDDGCHLIDEKGRGGWLSPGAVRRWQAALLLGAGYRGRQGLTLKAMCARPLAEAIEHITHLDPRTPVARPARRPTRRRAPASEIAIRFSPIALSGVLPRVATLDRSERTDLSSLCTFQLCWEPDRVRGRARAQVPDVLPVIEAEVLQDGGTWDAEFGRGIWREGRELRYDIEPVLRFRLSIPMDPDRFTACVARSTVRVRSAAQAAKGEDGLLLGDPAGERAIWMIGSAADDYAAFLRERKRFSGLVLTREALLSPILLSDLRLR